LVAYELAVKGWVSLSRSSEYISKDPAFAFLRKNNVEFYDITELQRVLGEKEEEEEEKLIYGA
jgi:hypothetical protein